MRVLVVDDHPTNRSILNEILLNWRMRPTLTESGRQAIAEIQQAADDGRPFSLMLLDVHMPEMDGFEVAKRVRAESKSSDLSVLMLSSADCVDGFERCRELGLAAYLVKPVKQSELLDSILNAVGCEQAEQKATLIQYTPTVEPVAEPAARGLRVLLAEDNFVNQQLMTRILQREGYDVVVAGNGRAAVRLATQEKVDLILMDVQMPFMDGLEATAEIRGSAKESVRRLPIIALTAHTMSGDREKCLAGGMDAYVSKPIQIAELRAAMSACIGGIQTAGATSDAFQDDALPVLDRDALLTRIDGDLQFLRSMLDVFRDDSTTQIQTIRSAMEAQDMSLLRRAAHTIKGSSGNIGGMRAAATALELESLARKGQWTGGSTLSIQLENDVADLLRSLQTLLDEEPI
jgi:CheY-like chemotaxis protein